MNHPARTHIGIVADDMTSATDGVSPFLSKGYAPLITRIDVGPWQSVLVAVDANSRALPEEQATQAMANAIAAMRDRPFLLKTIDSALRGDIRSEIAAAFRVSGRNRLVIAPAFADAGRVTKDRIQFVNGAPVSDSEHSSDPVNPARTSHIRELIDPALGAAMVLAVDGSQDRLDQAADTDVVILEADSKDSLNRQVARIPEPQNVMWVGSPGLAIALASLMPVAHIDRSTSSLPNRCALVVAGNANHVTHGQVQTLKSAGIPVVEDLASVPCNAAIVCLQAPAVRQADSSAVLVDIAGKAATALAQENFDAVIATGRETIAAILERLGISSFLLKQEMEPGFPVGLAELPDVKLLTIALKAGGFGSPSTLLDAALSLTSTTELLR